jgi:hypothetical protein
MFPALTTCDDPIEFTNPRYIHLSQEWFAGKESHLGRYIEEDRDTLISPSLIFNRSSHPNVIPSITPISRKHGGDVFRAFGQELPVKTIASPDDFPEAISPLDGNFTVEDVSHG